MSEIEMGSTTGETRAGHKSGLELDLARYMTSFEAEATTLERGFKTALFIQKFKAGLLLQRGRDVRRLQ